MSVAVAEDVREKEEEVGRDREAGGNAGEVAGLTPSVEDDDVTPSSASFGDAGRGDTVSPSLASFPLPSPFPPFWEALGRTEGREVKEAERAA